MARPTPTSSLKPATTSTPRVESNVAATLPSASSVSYVSYRHAGEKLNLYWTRMRNEWEPALATPYNETAEWIGELWLSAVNYWMVELELGKSRDYIERLDDPLLECVFETLDNDDDGKPFRIPRPRSRLIKLCKSRSAVSVDLKGPPPSQSTRKATKVYGRRTKEQASLHPSAQELGSHSEQSSSSINEPVRPLACARPDTTKKNGTGQIRAKAKRDGRENRLIHQTQTKKSRKRARSDGYDDEEDEEDEEEHREGDEDNDDAGDEVDGGGSGGEDNEEGGGGGGEDDVGHVVDDEMTSCDSDDSSLLKRPASRNNNPTSTQRKVLGKGPGKKKKKKSMLAAPRAKKRRIETQRSGPGATLPPPFDHDDILITCKRYFLFKTNWEDKDYKYLGATLASGRGLEILGEMSPADRKQAKAQLHRVIRSTRSSILHATLTAVAPYAKAWLRSEAGKTFLDQTVTLVEERRRGARTRRRQEFPRPIKIMPWVTLKKAKAIFSTNLKAVDRAVLSDPKLPYAHRLKCAAAAWIAAEVPHQRRLAANDESGSNEWNDGSDTVQEPDQQVNSPARLPEESEQFRSFWVDRCTAVPRDSTTEDGNVDRSLPKVNCWIVNEDRRCELTLGVPDVLPPPFMHTDHNEEDDSDDDEPVDEELEQELVDFIEWERSDPITMAD
ncbi:BZ3500_MvSof-1268-A1-R1_Chr10-2g02944 [Microbotryum saponariae]|uniref:BZ3500_MvSof-1268-A1-R1_Chr10-2g02944 protein n=1 Tax=Microbotryum saponariae TaxID=289078 RepID=A0A2X0KCN8_9BASI|nr:BZ3501_MvSof-1269-A2-R1_Chr10-2g02530 [Microbotryum saponariae]SDA01791.1 BZ3500_MvSof-1268-A1-R1_Chr10-2g02944 [Microbotryum saponariae]